ncbi:MAG: hypothetical protein LBT86_04570 [Deltaproteobacteria bacterium]|jgi:hypothetical protein|nr:hypothetical protein [Deltaproteobacteria bacterium]
MIDNEGSTDQNLSQGQDGLLDVSTVVDRNLNSLKVEGANALNFEIETKEEYKRLREENSRIKESLFQSAVNRVETSLKDKTDNLKNDVATTNKSIVELKESLKNLNEIINGLKKKEK